MPKTASMTLPRRIAAGLLLLGLAAPAWSQLTCTLTATQNACIGQKTPFTLKATGSGCTGPYTFTWTNVRSLLSTSTANPNFATALLTPGQCDATVTVSVTAMGYTCTRSLTLHNNCDSWCGGGVLDP